jgi:hypothetical protein
MWLSVTSTQSASSTIDRSQRTTPAARSRRDGPGGQNPGAFRGRFPTRPEDLQKITKNG